MFKVGQDQFVFSSTSGQEGTPIADYYLQVSSNHLGSGYTFVLGGSASGGSTGNVLFMMLDISAPGGVLDDSDFVTIGTKTEK